MALPSKRRPKEIEEDILEQFRENRIQPLKVKFSRAQIFNSHMCTWYEKLGKKKRRTVTAKILKRQAIEVCHILNYNYDHLPKNWIAKMKEECGLVIYPGKKEKKERKEEAFVPPAKPSGSVTRFPRTVKQAGAERLSAQLTGGWTQVKVIPGEKEGHYSSVTHIGPKKDDADKPRSKKRVIDFSNDLPPSSWLAAYARGIELPRRLRVFPTEDAIILYYDYSPQLKETDGSERAIKLQAQPRLNVSLLFSSSQSQK